MSFKVKHYKPIKVLKRGGKSLKVTLLENSKGRKIIMKEYDPNKSTHVLSFKKEIRILTGLKSYEYVPKLLKVDYRNCIFWETYCGVVPSDDDLQYRQKRIDRTKELYEKYGLNYIKYNKQIWTVHWKNYCMMNDEIYMIDFGSARWKGSFAEDDNKLPEEVKGEYYKIIHMDGEKKKEKKEKKEKLIYVKPIATSHSKNNKKY